MKLVIFPRVDEGWFQRIHAVSTDLTAVNCASEEEAEREIKDADGFYGRITPRLLQASRKLRWIQAPLAGLEHYIFPELIEHPAILTNMRGVYFDMVPEHAFGLILSLARGLHRYAWLQKERRWDPREVLLLSGQTLGIIGLGGIGGGVARRGAAFEMRVIALDPKAEKPPEVETLFRQDGLNHLLEQSDFVVICAPHTPETEKMIRRPQLQRMKRTAYLINVGRGVIVDLHDLTEALKAGEIAGAGLDVFEVEPLPADHPLWGMENVVITPHVAANTPRLAERWLGVLLENLHRFLKGEPLKNVVDKRRWF